MKKKLYITQKKSIIGCLPQHKATILGLGLRKIRHTVVREDTPSVRGMISKVSYMLNVREE